MLSALRKISETSKSPRRAVSVSNEPVEGNDLFEAFVCEFHWTALQIGAITCCMNASLASGRTWMLRSCINLVPVESVVVKQALRSWQDLELPRELAAAIGRIYFDLSDAKRLALPLIDSAGVFVGPQIPLAKLEQITAVWRKLAEDCNGAVQDLEPETRWRLNGLYTSNALVLGKFMKEAMTGKRSCVNQFGEVSLPVLPQRRRTRRFHVSAAVQSYIPRQHLNRVCARDFQEWHRPQLRARIQIEGSAIAGIEKRPPDEGYCRLVQSREGRRSVR